MGRFAVDTEQMSGVALGGLAGVVASLGGNLAAAVRACEITDQTAIGERYLQND